MCKLEYMRLFLAATAMYVLCMARHIIARVLSMDQPGKIANPARGQLNREN